MTGANSGIGRACAIGLAKTGARVGVNYVSGDDSAREVVAEIEALGGEAIALKGNVAQEHQVQDMFQTMIDTWGSIDISVNNASLQRDALLHELSLAD